MRRWRDWRLRRAPQGPPLSPPHSGSAAAARAPSLQQPPPIPLLLLAPMEGLADRPMRLALARLQRRAAARLAPADPRLDPPAVLAAQRAILVAAASASSSSSSSPGFDEACQEFIRVPGELPLGGRAQAVARGVCKAYRSDELGGTPLAAQLMGSDPGLMAAAASRLVSHRGATHVSTNCGCPANQVTGNGAGSSLLKNPRALNALVSRMSDTLRDGGGSPLLPPPLLSVKVRAGFDDASLFGDNALAARDGGAGMLVVHPRTKAQAYRGRADWSLVHRARLLLESPAPYSGGGGVSSSQHGSYDVPVVGNGDVVRAGDALALALSTGCGGVMVGRGSVQDPLLFLRVRAAFGAMVCLRESDSDSRWGYDEELLLEGGNGGDGDAVRRESRLLREACAAAGRALRFSSPLDDSHEQGGGGEAALIESFLRDYFALADAETRLRRGGGRGSAARAGGGAGAGAAGEEEGCGAAFESQGDDGGGHGGNSNNNNNERGRLGRLKSVIRYVFTGRPRLRAALEPLLRASPGGPGASDDVLDRACAAVREHWRDGGCDDGTPLVSHMSQSLSER